MFPRAYFAGRMFAPRYYPQSSGTAPPTGGAVRATAGGGARVGGTAGGGNRVGATAGGGNRVGGTAGGA